MTKNFVSNKDVTVRMFESDFLEAFSRIHYTVPLFIFLPVIAYFLYRSILFSLSASVIVLFIIFGLIVWSLTEYTLHRFVFHFPAKSEFGKKIHFIFHGVHHDYPMDSKRLVMVPTVSIPLSILFYYLFEAIFGVVYVAPLFIGFIAGYLFYDLTHYAIHHFNMHSKLWLAIKKHHIKHHFENENLGYGVSSPIWDKIIGTDFPKKK
ncbi:MAG TPA: fatty acid hydroxylase [Ignavibacteria bacterium]|nr:fatty acid hydroxylase [Ignavibacteria bacterium]